MFDLFSNMESVFWFCALAGSGVFIIQLICSLMGIVDYDDINNRGDLEIHHFKWLSRQAITGFLMLFGWTGITCYKEMHMQVEWTIIVATLAGLLTVFMTSLIFKAAKKLHSTGTVFNLADVIGKEAMVYQSIPKDGTGKITMNLQSGTFEIDAVSAHQEEITSFTQVQIIKQLNAHTVTVTAIK